MIACFYPERWRTVTVAEVRRLPAMISASIALCFSWTLPIQSRRGLAKRLLVVTEPPIPAVLLRNNPAPDEALRGFAQVSLVAQNRLRISQLVDLQ
jgi:hypothetical protein